jgi:hypothetical protein
VISDESSTGAPFAPNAFLRIDRAGKVTFVMPFIEGSVQSYVQKRCLSSKRGMVMVRG